MFKRTQAVLIAALIYSPSGAFAVAVSTAPVPLSWAQLPINPADIPGRCGPERTAVSLTPYDIYSFGSDRTNPSVDSQIDGMLRADVRKAPQPIIYFAKSSDYYARRAERQRQIESRIAELPQDERVKALGNYAMALVYLGEFKKLAAYFAPDAGPYLEARQEGTVDFALAHALYRLGRPADSLKHAERAYALLQDAILDTRWQVMLSASEAAGSDFFKKDSKIYSTKHVKELFPARRWELPFEDATASAGIDRWGGYGSALFTDMDADGYDDLLLERKFFPFKIYKNEGGRAFTPLSEKAVGKQSCNSVLSYTGDYDNDGRPDIFRNCCNFDGPGPASLLRNRGDWSFENVAERVGLSTPPAGGTGACWGDYDLDGNLDLVVNAFRGPTRLHRGNGDGTFTEVAKKAGLATPGGMSSHHDFGGLGCSFGDVNGDRYPDLFLQGWGWRKLFINTGQGGFRDATKESGIGAGDKSKGYMSLMFDYDNDGRMDILAGSYVVASNEKWGMGPACLCSNLLTEEGFSEREWAAATTLFRNNGDGTFTDMRKQARFMPLASMSFAHADWNNDGHEDFSMGCGGGYIQQIEPYLFYQNNGDGTFINKTPFLMKSLWGKGHGMAFGDYDHDGQLDVLLNNGGGFDGDLWPGVLLHNTGTGNHWLNVSLKPAPGTNASAIGARVTVEAGKLRQVKEIQSGGTFSVSSLALHFGLAAQPRAERIVVEWPNRKKTVTELKDIAADQALEISEETASYKRLWGAAAKAAP